MIQPPSQSPISVYCCFENRLIIWVFGCHLRSKSQVWDSAYRLHTSVNTEQACWHGERIMCAQSQSSYTSTIANTAGGLPHWGKKARLVPRWALTPLWADRNCMISLDLRVVHWFLKITPSNPAMFRWRSWCPERGQNFPSKPSVLWTTASAFLEAVVSLGTF